MRANQIEFLNLIIDHLTEHGSMDARLLYDSPYTDFSPRGVDGVFESKEVDFELPYDQLIPRTKVAEQGQ